MFATKSQMQKVEVLKDRKDFLAVQKQGRKWIGKAVIVEWRSDEDQEDLRFGLTVSKKTAKKAVTRNRIKRRLRAAAYATLCPLQDVSGDVVLIGRPQAENMPFDKLLGEINWCLKRLEVRAQAGNTRDEERSKAQS